MLPLTLLKHFRVFPVLKIFILRLWFKPALFVTMYLIFCVIFPHSTHHHSTQYIYLFVHIYLSILSTTLYTPKFPIKTGTPSTAIPRASRTVP